MRLSVILGVCVLCVAVVANATTLPVNVTGGNITVGATRTSYNASYDEVEFYLTGMTGAAAGLNTDGSQCRINILEGRWTAGATGAFRINSATGPNSQYLNYYKWWTTDTDTGDNILKSPVSNTCAVNFDSTVAAATIWTNTGLDAVSGVGGGRGPQPSGVLYNFFSGSWKTEDYRYDMVYPANLVDYPAFEDGQAHPQGPNSTIIADMIVTKATPDAGIAYDGKMSFTYNGGTVEVVHFATVVTTPEPGTLALLAAGLMGLVAYAWRKRK